MVRLIHLIHEQKNFQTARDNLCNLDIHDSKTILERILLLYFDAKKYSAEVYETETEEDGFETSKLETHLMDLKFCDAIFFPPLSF